MLFRQRFKPQFWQSIRLFLWPRRSWVRSFEYLKKRVLRLSATPHIIALGFAAGAFASCTPFVGFHFLIAFAIAFMIGGNMIAAAIGTAVGNPISFPFIWATTFNIGSRVLSDAKPHFVPDEISHEFFAQSLEKILPIFSRMLVGSIPIGLVVAGICYAVIRVATHAYQQARRRRLREMNAHAVGAGAQEGVQAAK